MAGDEKTAVHPAEIRSLAELFESDSKRFEWMAKQYYDLFAYHAAQRLTAFNFFLVSLSFFSTAYATLITRSGEGVTNYFPVAGALASAAYFLVVAFGRLDKRNEQIISINEKPLIRIQRAIRLGLAPLTEAGDDVWETFVQTDKSYRFRTFGELLPLIYCLAATACAAGAMYGLSGPGDRLHKFYFPLWLIMSLIACIAIYWPLSKARNGAGALREAEKVVRLPATAKSVDQAPAKSAAAATAAAPEPKVTPLTGSRSSIE
jgi:hypothetical protein